MTSILPVKVAEEILQGGIVPKDLTPEEFRQREAGGAIKHDFAPRIFKAIALIEKAGDDDDDGINNKYRAVISTSKPDRDGDILDMEGFDLKPFRRNPVVLFGHDHNRLIGSADSIDVKGETLVSAFHVNIDIPLGLEVATLLNAKDIRATSVGFKLLEGHPVAQGKEEDCPRCVAHKGELRGSFFRPSMHMKKMELLEFSIVAVPANAGALVRMKDAASRLTLDSGMMELLDVDNQALTDSRLDSLERRIDALVMQLQASDVKVLGAAVDDGDEDATAALLKAATIQLKIRRALSR